MPTTAETIRTKQKGLIQSLNGSQLRAVKFREHTHRSDFREWAEDNPGACMRRFQINDLMTYESPLVSDMVEEQQVTSFEVVVAYPADGRFGRDELMGVSDAIRSDMKKIDTAIGHLGTANYVAGQNASILQDSEVERGDQVWFLSMEFEIMFYRSIDLGFTDLNGTVSARATVSGALSQIMQVAGTVNASASVSANLVRVGALSGTVNASATVSGNINALTAASIEEIADAADPMQALIDAMGHTVKPDYLWIGNEASGATELGGSGRDLTATTVDQSQTDSRISDGDVTVFDANGDKLALNHADLNIGSDSVAIINIHVFDSFGTRYIVSKYGSAGFRNYCTSSGQRVFGVATSLRTPHATVAVNHGTTNAQVDLCRRDVTAGFVYLDTREGSASAAETAIGSADNSSEFSIGSNAGSSFRGSWGLTAMWKGSDAEDITAAMRTALQTQLGLD